MAALLLTAGSGNAQTIPSPLTLDEAVAAALAANPSLAAARLGRTEAALREEIARQRPDPELQLSEQRDAPRDAAALAFPIETGGKRRRRIEVAAAETRSGEAEIARLAADLRSQVRRAYFGLASAQRRAHETGEIRDVALRARDAARERFESGDAPRLEALQAELAAAQAESEAERARDLLTGARAGLNALLARPPGGPLTVTDDLTAGRVPPVDEAVRQTLAASAELAALDLGIAAQRARVELARAEAVPDLTAGAGVTHHAEPDFTWGWTGQLTMTLPVFTRVRAQARLEEATLARLRAERDAAAARLAGQVAAAVATAGAQRQAVERYQREILPRSDEVARMAEDSYRSGQTNLTTLLQALQSAHDLRLQAIQAGADYQDALADLEAAMGVALP